VGADDLVDVLISFVSDILFWGECLDLADIRDIWLLVLFDGIRLLFISESDLRYVTVRCKFFPKLKSALSFLYITFSELNIINCRKQVEIIYM
jgi:hypothetical protein